HDRGGARGGIAGGEDAGADEHPVGPQLHHHRGVGRGGHAARDEQGTGSSPASATSSTRAYGACSSFAATYSSSSLFAASSRIWAEMVRMCLVASETSPVPASPLERIIAAPSVMRRSASPRFVAPHTKGTVKRCLSMWWT